MIPALVLVLAAHSDVDCVWTEKPVTTRPHVSSSNRKVIKRRPIFKADLKAAGVQWDINCPPEQESGALSAIPHEEEMSGPTSTAEYFVPEMSVPGLLQPVVPESPGVDLEPPIGPAVSAGSFVGSFNGGGVVSGPVYFYTGGYVSAVPEPESWALLIAGSLFIWLKRFGLAVRRPTLGDRE